MDKLETGDLILFSYSGTGCSGIFSKLIKWGTESKFTHIGIVLINPNFNGTELNGMFVWESGYEGLKDPQDGKIKLGVQITPINEIVDSYKNNGEVFIRKLENIDRKKIFSNTNLEKIHKVVYDKPYDLVPTDWIEALLRKDLRPKKTDRFWCSALVGYIYTKLGILPENTDWSILRPCDFSGENNNITLTNNYTLKKLEKIE